MLWRPTTCSSWIITSQCHLLLLWYLWFLLVYPLAATPLFPPCQLVPPKGVSQCAPQGLPPCRRGGGCRCVHAIYYFHHRVSPDLSAMASPTLAVDPSDTASSKQKSNLRVVWRGSQRVNYKCMYVMYNSIIVCMPYMSNSGGIVGGGGTNKSQFFLIFIFSYIIFHMIYFAQ